MIRVGLLGGSFNPAHNGHRDISLLAMKHLQLDFVWWLVTPQNPLKTAQGLTPLKERVCYAKRISHHPRILVKDIEQRLRTRYTYDTLKKLTAQNPHMQFVWLMGADNLGSFHKWKNWQAIARLVPICIIDRPTDSLTALSSRAAQALKPYRVEVRHLMQARPPAWVFLHGVKNALSSTKLRALQVSSVL